MNSNGAVSCKPGLIFIDIFDMILVAKYLVHGSTNAPQSVGALSLGDLRRSCYISSIPSQLANTKLQVDSLSLLTAF